MPVAITLWGLAVSAVALFIVHQSQKMRVAFERVPDRVHAESPTVPLATTWPVFAIPVSVSTALTLDRTPSTRVAPWDDDPFDDDPAGDTEYERAIASLAPEDLNPPYPVKESFLHSVLRSQPWPMDRRISNLRGETAAWEANASRYAQHARTARHSRNEAPAWRRALRVGQRFVSAVARAGGRT